MSDKDLNALIDKLVDYDLKTAQLNKIYTEKFKKVLTPMKIILLRQAENDFKRHLYRGTHGKSHNSKK